MRERKRKGVSRVGEGDGYSKRFEGSSLEDQGRR